MSATETPGAEGDSAADRRYFQAIEELFIRLRGAPLLLSPADWRVAQEWRRQGIPFELVEETLTEVFRRRAERQPRDPVSSLRYCRRAVEKAWGEARELTATADRAAAPQLDLAATLAALAALLPPDLPGSPDLAARIRNLEGSAEAVEEALARLDQELLETAEAALPPVHRQTLETTLAQTLATLARRLPPEQIQSTRPRLHRQLLREHLRLPVLSLFAVPEVGEEG